MHIFCVTQYSIHAPFHSFRGSDAKTHTNIETCHIQTLCLTPRARPYFECLLHYIFFVLVLFPVVDDASIVQCEVPLVEGVERMGFLVHVAFEYRGVQGEPVDVHLAGDGDFLLLQGSRRLGTFVR